MNIIFRLWDIPGFKKLDAVALAVGQYVVAKAMENGAVPGLFRGDSHTLAAEMKAFTPEQVAKAVIDLSLVDPAIVEMDEELQIIRVPLAPEAANLRNPKHLMAWFCRWLELPNCAIKWRHIESIKQAIAKRLQKPETKEAWLEAWRKTFGSVQVPAKKPAQAAAPVPTPAPAPVSAAAPRGQMDLFQNGTNAVVDKRPEAAFVKHDIMPCLTVSVSVSEDLSSGIGTPVSSPVPDLSEPERAPARSQEQGSVFGSGAPGSAVILQEAGQLAQDEHYVAIPGHVAITVPESTEWHQDRDGDWFTDDYEAVASSDAWRDEVDTPADEGGERAEVEGTPLPAEEPEPEEPEKPSKPRRAWDDHVNGAREFRRVQDAWQKYFVALTGSKPDDWATGAGGDLKRLVERRGADEVIERIRVRFENPPTWMNGVPTIRAFCATYDALALPAARAGPRKGGTTASDLERLADEIEQRGGVKS